MFELKFRDDKRALKRLGRVQNSIDKFLSSHKGELNKRQHKKLRKLLNKRADALSKATGLKIHSVCD